MKWKWLCYLMMMCVTSEHCVIDVSEQTQRDCVLLFEFLVCVYMYNSLTLCLYKCMCVLRVFVCL